MKKILTSLLIAISAILMSSASFAGPVGWSIAGPGTISATENYPLDWDLSYSLNPAGHGTVTWNAASTTIDQAGDYTFEWNYTGFHAFYGVTAFLNTSDLSTLVNAGPQNCCTSPSNGFNYSGIYTFAGLNVGDVIGFNMGGSNGDSDNRLLGNLNLVQISSVPEPGSLLLLGAGFAALGLRRRRRV